MKLYVKFLMFILVLGVAGLFVLKRPDGNPWLDYRAMMPDWQSMKYKVENSVTEMTQEAAKISGSDNAGEVKVYRWKGPDGAWKFSDSPPPQGGADEVWVDPNQNLIQGIDLSKPAVPEAENQQPGGPAIPMPMTVSPGQVQKLMEDARGVQDLMDQRQKALEQQLAE